jgi:hypothetical protein
MSAATFTKIMIAVLIVIVLAVSYASAATAAQVRTHTVQVHNDFEKTWFAIAEGRDSM